MTNTKTYVTEGDITRIPADALMTAINSGGMWFGGIDGTIQRVAGNLYHAQAEAAMPLRNLQTVIARGGARPDRKIGFRDVVFIVDDLESPLNEVVYTGLEAASNQGYKHILVPTIRIGVMAGAREKTPQEAVRKMARGVNEFLDKYAERTKLENIEINPYESPKADTSLDLGISHLTPLQRFAYRLMIGNIPAGEVSDEVFCSKFKRLMGLSAVVGVGLATLTAYYQPVEKIINYFTR